MKFTEVVGGFAFLSPVGQALWSLRLRRSRDAPQRARKIAIVAHVFYPELLPEILACRRNCPESHLHVTTTTELASVVMRALIDEPDVHIHAFENRGRDIAPFVALISAGALDSYDVALKIHTKRSRHLLTGNLRRRLLFAMLVGRREQVARILSTFDDESVGLVGWRASFRNRPIWWMANRARVSELAARMAPTAEAKLGFFEGSMFWFRPPALAPLKSLSLTPDAFEEEAGQLDGALQHAIERLFPIAAAAAGYCCADVDGRVLELRNDLK